MGAVTKRSLNDFKCYASSAHACKRPHIKSTFCIRILILGIFSAVCTGYMSWYKFDEEVMKTRLKPLYYHTQKDRP
jgi:hypothetical protein